MKRKGLLGALTALLLCAVVAFAFIYNAFASTQYFPDTPKEYHDLPSLLFSSRTLSTGSNEMNLNDNWKYYLWCDFTPQYSADYSVRISCIKKMKIELYDENENLLASACSPTEANDGYNYAFTLTYPLEQGTLYYYKIAFTGGYFNSCGPFNISFESTGGPLVESDDNLHLYVAGSKNRTVFEQSTYSYSDFIESLSMKVVYKNGVLYQWSQKDNGYFTLNGCDILFNFSDCTEEIGKHKVFVHYMGYYAEATYEIVECIHSYKEEYVSPKWLEKGEVRTVCEKCGDVLCVEYTPQASEIYAEFLDIINTKEGDLEFERSADFNNDGYINIRDYKFLRDLYADALNEMFLHFNESKSSENFNESLDLNGDGYINMRDYTLLYYTGKAIK